MLLVPSLVLAALSLALAPNNSAAQGKPDAPIQIGMVNTFFNGVPRELAELVVAPFGDVMKKNTALDGKLNIVDGTFNVTEQLSTGKVKLGVFHGHEFAWAKKKEPKLAPLVIVVNDHDEVAAYVVVKKDNPATKLEHLSGKTIDVPKMTKEHCLVFLEKNCTDNGQPDWKKYFAKVKESASFYDALDDVAGGKTHAVLVDTIPLEFYKSIRKAVYDKNLRILKKSDLYPPPVIAYKEGTFDAATLKVLRDGLLNANKCPDGKVLLREWMINRFEPVPADYQKSLNAVLKEHPLPAESAVKVGMR